MVERASKFVLVVAGSACFMLILYQYAGPGLSLGAPGGRAPPDDLDLFPRRTHITRKSTTSRCASWSARCAST